MSTHPEQGLLSSLMITGALCEGLEEALAGRVREVLEEQRAHIRALEERVSCLEGRLREGDAVAARAGEGAGGRPDRREDEPAAGRLRLPRLQSRPASMSSSSLSIYILPSQPLLFQPSPQTPWRMIATRPLSVHELSSLLSCSLYFNRLSREQAEEVLSELTSRLGRAWSLRDEGVHWVSCRAPLKAEVLERSDAHHILCEEVEADTQKVGGWGVVVCLTASRLAELDGLSLERSW